HHDIELRDVDAEFLRRALPSQRVLEIPERRELAQLELYLGQRRFSIFGCCVLVRIVVLQRRPPWFRGRRPGGSINDPFSLSLRNGFLPRGSGHGQRRVEQRSSNRCDVEARTVRELEDPVRLPRFNSSWREPSVNALRSAHAPSSAPRTH